jgi:uncharacterized membrane protein
MTSFESSMLVVTEFFEGAGVLVLVIGGLYSLVRYAAAFVRRPVGATAYSNLRDDLGRSILLALEILVAADIIRTLAVQPSLANVEVLGLIVLIRTFLSFSLDIEIGGVLPWRRSREARSGQ